MESHCLEGKEICVQTVDSSEKWNIEFLVLKNGGTLTWMPGKILIELTRE